MTESLGEYVSRILRQKGLSLRKVEANCHNKLTASYIGRIAKGKFNNPSMETIAALAEGLGVDLNEIFTVAYGKPPSEAETSLLVFADAVQKMAMNPELIELVRGWEKLNNKQKKGILYTFDYFEQKRKKSTSRKKS
jgi:transcriptional regulator with XRE-family HTH domain